MNETIHRYPRTRHVEGSRLQPGDEDMEAAPFKELAGRHLVVEEKVDGANAGVSFAPDGALLLQSRGHYLVGGPRERHFDLFKQWGTTHADALRARLGTRYVMYGEWLFAKHTMFYDHLPHYFLEFDVLDRDAGEFLDAPRRRELLSGLPVVSVRVLREGPVRSLKELAAMIGRSAFISDDHLATLRAAAERLGLDAERILRETDPSATMEGLYVKAEEAGVVRGRYKLIRPSFLTSVVDSGTHWLARPVVPNQLAEGTDLFASGSAGGGGHGA